MRKKEIRQIFDKLSKVIPEIVKRELLEEELLFDDDLEL